MLMITVDETALAHHAPQIADAVTDACGVTEDRGLRFQWEVLSRLSETTVFVAKDSAAAGPVSVRFTTQYGEYRDVGGQTAEVMTVTAQISRRYLHLGNQNVSAIIGVCQASDPTSLVDLRQVAEPIRGVELLAYAAAHRATLAAAATSVVLTAVVPARIPTPHANSLVSV